MINTAIQGNGSKTKKMGKDPTSTPTDKDTKEPGSKIKKKDKASIGTRMEMSMRAAGRKIEDTALEQ